MKPDRNTSTRPLTGGASATSMPPSASADPATANPAAIHGRRPTSRVANHNDSTATMTGYV